MMKLHATAFSDRAAIEARMHAHGVPGLTYTLIQGGARQDTVALGVKRTDTNEPMTPDTTFEAASLTKSLFALLVLRLADEGVLSLDTPLRVYREEPGFCDDARFARVTARHVLSHASGLPNWAKKPLSMEFNPGEGFRYSGEGYYYLQRVVEQLCGASMPALFDKYFFTPWGMSHSSGIWNPSVGAAMTHIFDENSVMQEKREAVDLGGLAPEPNAAWSLYATSGDYARILTRLMNGRSGLSPDTLREMTRAHNRATGAVLWGLGFGIPACAPSVVWHWGDNGGFRSFSIFDKCTRDGAVIFTNSKNGTALCLELLAAHTDGAFFGDVADFIAHAE